MGVFNKVKDEEKESGDARVAQVKVEAKVEEVEPAAVEAEVVLRVKAQGTSRMAGFFNNVRIAGGQEFVLENRSQFSGLWMEAIGWDPKIDEKFVKLVRDESLSQQNRDYRAERAAKLHQSSKNRALSGEATTLSQIGGVAKMRDSKPNKKEEVI